LSLTPSGYEALCGTAAHLQAWRANRLARSIATDSIGGVLTSCELR
jgi:hypothetical protein